MANLLDIKRRIGSVTNTQKITRAMKMVAAAKLRRAQESIIAARPYAYRVRNMVSHLANRAELDLHPLLRRDKAGTGKVALVVITSARGLCGAFNGSVVQEALRVVNETFSGREVELTVIGRKGAELLSRRDVTIAATHTDMMGGSIRESAAMVIEEVASRFIAKETSEVYCLYNVFKSAIAQEVTLERLLPFEQEDSEERAHTDFIYEPSPTIVFEALLTQHLQVQMQRVLMESEASEHGARMTAMDSATTNAGEMIDRLTLIYNRARQDAITTELIEVVSGSQAL